MKIYLVRHSESEDDLIDAYGGAADWKLTEAGKKTVKKFRDNHKDLEFDVIYSSPLSRAYDTASIINENRKVKIKTLFGLREFNQYGVMSGCTKEHAKQVFGYLLDNPKYKVLDYYKGKVFYGGETVSALDKRVKNTFEKIVADLYKNVLVVTHTGVFKSLCKNILGSDKKIKKIADCGMLEFKYDKKKLTLTSVEGVTFE